jgi:hypothetical protein
VTEGIKEELDAFAEWRMVWMLCDSACVKGDDLEIEASGKALVQDCAESLTMSGTSVASRYDFRTPAITSRRQMESMPSCRSLKSIRIERRLLGEWNGSHI